MDNMLYIIAGLVLILLVAGLVLRKKKAQEPSVQPHVVPRKHAATQTPVTKTGYDTPAPSNTDNNKFDHITIAQRFIDQQRYDKAIETLNRGLNEKPNDGQLSLKLLSVYATIDQPENFNNVYDAIKAHNDSSTIVRANELKELFFEEQKPVVAQEMSVEDDTSFESMDFDLSTKQVDDKNVASDQPVAGDSSNTLINDPVDNLTLSNEFHETGSTTENAEDNFDLTLSDLENDFDEPAATSATPVTSLDISDDESLDTSTTDGTATIEDSDISDFDFNFDISEEDNAPTEPSITSNTADSAAEEMALDNEEFILDFDDLTTDADDNTEETTVEELTVDAAENNEDDFELSLDSLDGSNSIETVLESENPVLEESNDIDNFVLEDNTFEDSTFEKSNLIDSSLEDKDLEYINLEEQLFNDYDLESPLTEAPNVTPTAPLLFDDNTLLDDDFETDASIATTSAAPVKDKTVVTSDDEAETVEDFSARFSADFDFVKSLDSNQVTLDLAGQYLQLGEYDSAKRLLNEVMTQGNSEQQKQATVLLERTA